MKKQLSLFTAILSVAISFAQNAEPIRPKLIVGLVFDQMRWDYLYRYSEKYGNDGFKRLLNEGYSCENTQIPYYRAHTAVGHATIYTGSVPAIHGITGNDWYDRAKQKMVYCVEDKTVFPVGGSYKTGQKSPDNLLVTTITDELRLATNFRSKTVSLALKDRSAILPAGHAANAAYWYDDSTGCFMSSSHYMNELPAWVNNFNKKQLHKTLLQSDWSLLLKADEYSQSTGDDVDWEEPFKEEKRPVFPRYFSQWKKENFNKLITKTPQGNTFTFEFAKAAIEGDTLGNRGATDFLAVSFSSTDYIGHQFGVNAVETEDAYIRVDKDLADFLKYLDDKIGKGNYLLFLSADHGAAHAAGFSRHHKIPSSHDYEEDVEAALDTFIREKYGDSVITSFFNHQVYLNRKKMAEKDISYDDLIQSVSNFFIPFKTVNRVVDLHDLGELNLPDFFRTRIENMQFPARSGDLEIIPTAARLDGYAQGTTHGTPYPYDTHIPLIFFGWKVKNAKDFSQIYMNDIARTLAAMLSIQEPNGCTGKVIEGLLK